MPVLAGGMPFGLARGMRRRRDMPGDERAAPQHTIVLYAAPVVLWALVVGWRELLSLSALVLPASHSVPGLSALPPYLVCSSQCHFRSHLPVLLRFCAAVRPVRQHESGVYFLFYETLSPSLSLPPPSPSPSHIPLHTYTTHHARTHYRQATLCLTGLAGLSPYAYVVHAARGALLSAIS